MKNLQLVSGSVVETDHPFLALWPHRFDYIWAEHPAFDEKPKWQTETRHPLSDRLILQGAYLYGVRFGPTTQYIMLDIDRGSIYHPARDSLAISRIRSALEDIGLTDGVFCTSSYSGGLHLYFPFEEAQKTWQVAIAITTLLENKGFKFAPGHLEIFPNPRHYCPNGERTLYHAHRLPLQTGSYLLDSQLEPVSSSPDRFVELWHYAAARNSLTSEIVSRILKAAQRQQYRVTAKAEKFLNDLNAEIEMGWTGPGMTNRLLGRIAMRSYVFGHILYASQPLTGEALVEDIVRHARALPGFYEWSNHVEELEEKARQWARSVEKSHYFHYGSGKALKPQSAAQVSKRQEQQQASREKIRQAIATLLETDTLPANATARFKLLTQQFNIGGKTLYKYRDLWHPDHLIELPPGENPPDPPTLKVTSEQERLEGAPCSEGSPNLLEETECNALDPQALAVASTPDQPEERCKSSEPGGLFDIHRAIAAVKEHIKEHIEKGKAEQAKQREQYYQSRFFISREKLVDRMQAYLESGDPVLYNEALNWFRSQPECVAT